MVTTSSGDNDPTVYNNSIQFSLSSDSPFVSFIPLLQSRIDLALHCNQRLFVVESDIDLYIRHIQMMTYVLQDQVDLHILHCDSMAYIIP